MWNSGAKRLTFHSMFTAIILRSLGICNINSPPHATNLWQPKSAGSNLAEAVRIFQGKKNPSVRLFSEGK